MHAWGPGVQVMNGRIREVLMAMVNSMKLEESCCLSRPLMRLQYATLGIVKVTSIS